MNIYEKHLRGSEYDYASRVATSTERNCGLSKFCRFFRWMQNRAKIRPNVALVRKHCAASLQFLTLAGQQIGKSEKNIIVIIISR